MDENKLLEDIKECKKALNQIVFGEASDLDINIKVGDRTYCFYDHAALVQGLLDALDYFESELLE